jgi:hypothetical protein
MEGADNGMVTTGEVNRIESNEEVNMNGEQQRYG